MDLSNYEQIVDLIRKLCKGMSPDDQDDMIQDVFLKLLVSDGYRKALETASLKHISKAMVRRVVKQIKLDRARKRGPKLIYDNELVEKYSEES